MTLTATLQRACRMPPHVLARKVAGRLRREFHAWRERRRDQKTTTYAPTSVSFEQELGRYFEERLASVSRSPFTKRFLDHQFNLLGSGWVQVAHGMVCKGVEGFRYSSGPCVHVDANGCWLAGRINAANLAEAQRLWRMIDPGYVPIDWHLDFKSGGRWAESTWARDLRYGERPGVDVKVPWELARMQHLPMLACAFTLEKNERCVREFRNQVLDFLATNPPRFGVNWHCTMDAAIRVCNWLVAYDLFRTAGARFDAAFRAIFHRAVYEHAWHIAHHLEWNAELRGNHYLANIVGLIFAGSYLPPSVESDAWLALGIRELINEVQLQFDEDGANFEASCSYHGLSSEMVLWATGLVRGLPPDRCAEVSTFPPWYIERLQGMARFSADITRPDRQIPQFGDNDSGRFLKWPPHPQPLSPEYRGEGRNDAVAKYPRFGLFIYRKPELYLAIRCGPVGQNDHGGHAHNDQLSFELCLKGRAILVDPGTYLYTPMPDLRNRFRSTAMHNTLAIPGREQNAWLEGPAGLFRLSNDSRAAVQCCESEKFVGEHHGFGVPCRRTLLIGSDHVKGVDECPLDGPKDVGFHLTPGVQVEKCESRGWLELISGEVRITLHSEAGEWVIEPSHYSPGYGIVEPTLALRLRSESRQIEWQLQWTER